MCPQSTLETRRQTAQHSTFRGGGKVAELLSGLAQMTMVSQETDWIWAQDTLGLFFFFFPGRGVKSRLQCWGCMHPAPQGADKKYGALSLSLCLSHAHTHTHTHTPQTHALAFSLFIYAFSLPLIISSIIKSGEKLIIFWKSAPMLVFHFDTTQEGNRQSLFVEIWIS